jgi:deoxyribose-phosphate aldolase
MANMVQETARRIDHTLLKAEATVEQIDALCDEALAHGFAAVCVNPIHVRRAAGRLAAGRSIEAGGHVPAVASVAGFPLGANTTATKVDEASRALDDGATEIDMVVCLGALKAEDAQGVREDVEAVARAVHAARPSAILKVILEAAALTTEQIMLGCRCCVEAEADFVKTSTGFHPAGGATVEHVRLLHQHAHPLLVKASGGIRTAAAVRAMVEAGAARIGTSSGVAIIAELQRAI